MTLFSNTVTGLQAKSKGIIDVFTKTVNSLKKVNEEIVKETTKKDEEMKKLFSDSKLLVEQKEANEKIITKIESFLV